VRKQQRPPRERYPGRVEENRDMPKTLDEVMIKTEKGYSLTQAISILRSLNWAVKKDATYWLCEIPGLWRNKKFRNEGRNFGIVFLDRFGMFSIIAFSFSHIESLQSMPQHELRN
jgi:hypothetical protein